MTEARESLDRVMSPDLPEFNLGHVGAARHHVTGETMIGSAVVVCAFSIGMGTAHADGSGTGASQCSYSGQPDGVVDLPGGFPSGTYDNPGEVISYIAHVNGSSAPGVRDAVAAICNPNR